MTPIHYASRSKDKDILKLLLDRDKNNQSLYLICQDQGNPLHCLLENPNNVESGDDDLLHTVSLQVFISLPFSLEFKHYLHTYLLSPI